MTEFSLDTATHDDATAHDGVRAGVRAGTGDRGADAAESYTELYRRLAAPVLRCVTSVLLDHAQSEEVAQEVLLEVWLNYDRFDARRSQVTTWATMIARRRAIDRVRSSQSSHVRDLRVGIAEWMPEADDSADTAQTRLDFRRALEALPGIPSPQRQAIVLCYLDGLSRAEVARALGVPLSTSNWHIRQGLDALRRLLS